MIEFLEFLDTLRDFYGDLVHIGLAKFAIAYFALPLWFLIVQRTLKHPKIRAAFVNEKTKPFLQKMLLCNLGFYFGSMAFWLGSLTTLLMLTKIENYLLLITGQTQQKIGDFFLLVVVMAFIMSFIFAWMDAKYEKESDKKGEIE